MNTSELCLGRERMDVWKEVSPTRDGLVMLISKARRRHVWYRELHFSERRYIEAVVKVVERLRSALLIRVVGRIVERILHAMRGSGGDIGYMIKTVGKPLAIRLSYIAYSWGYKSALRWVQDLSFLRYLSVMYINGGFH